MVLGSGHATGWIDEHAIILGGERCARRRSFFMQRGAMVANVMRLNASIDWDRATRFETMAFWTNRIRQPFSLKQGFNYKRCCVIRSCRIAALHLAPGEIMWCSELRRDRTQDCLWRDDCREVANAGCFSSIGKLQNRLGAHDDIGGVKSLGWEAP